MGGFITVVVIIVIVVIIKKLNYKKTIEKLKNSTTYTLARRIKEELEKKGGSFIEPTFDNGLLYDSFTGSVLSVDVRIGFSVSIFELGLWETIELKHAAENFKRLMGIKNNNIAVSVTATSLSDKQDSIKNMEQVINIASEVIENSGYGRCIEIQPWN